MLFANNLSSANIKRSNKFDDSMHALMAVARASRVIREMHVFH